MTRWNRVQCTAVWSNRCTLLLGSLRESSKDSSDLIIYQQENIGQPWKTCNSSSEKKTVLPEIPEIPVIPVTPCTVHSLNLLKYYLKQS